MGETRDSEKCSRARLTSASRCDAALKEKKKKKKTEEKERGKRYRR